MPQLYGWFVLAALVGVLVVTRIVPRFPVGAVAIVAMIIACPMFDDGFFWIEWGSADGVPGHGLWSACWIAATGLILLYPYRGRKPLLDKNGPDEGAVGLSPASELPT